MGEKLKPAIIQTFKAAGEPGVKVKNALHGTWLGHPLHPMLTDIPLGSWTTAAVLDGVELTGNTEIEHLVKQELSIWCSRFQKFILHMAL